MEMYFYLQDTPYYLIGYFGGRGSASATNRLVIARESA